MVLNKVKSEISCKLSVIGQSDGSGEFSQGNTSAIASVYGPNESKQMKELLNDMNIVVSFKSKVSSQINEKLQVESFLENVCMDSVFVKDFPKSSLIVVVQELENDGSLLACTVNALSAALLESAIPLKSCFAAVNIAITTDGTIIYNPTLKQELDLPSTTFVLNKAGHLLASQTFKISSESIFEKSLEAAINYVPTIFEVYKNQIGKQL